MLISLLTAPNVGHTTEENRQKAPMLANPNELMPFIGTCSQNFVYDIEKNSLETLQTVCTNCNRMKPVKVLINWALRHLDTKKQWRSDK